MEEKRIKVRIKNRKNIRLSWSKKKHLFASIFLFVLFSAGYTIFFSPVGPYTEEYKPFDLPIRQAVRTNENVDADSDVDGSANIGTNTSDYTNTISQNSVFQNITEASSGGGTTEPTINAVYTVGTGTKVSSTDLTSVTVSGSNRALYCFLHHTQKSAAGGAFASSVVWDAAGVNEAFTVVTSSQVENDEVIMELWNLTNPTAKTATITVTWTDSDATSDGGVVGCYSLQGVHQTYPHDAIDSNTGTGTSISVTITTDNDDLVLDGVAFFDVTDTINAETGDGTQQYNVLDDDTSGASSNSTGTVTTNSHSWTTTESNLWVAIGLAINGVSGGTNYRLNWEHQTTSVPTGSDNFYNLTVYAQATEDIDVYLWNSSSSTWNATKIFTISTTLQWHNYTISGTGIIGSTITWNYQDTVIVSDTTQHVLSIDYAGIYVWSMTVSINQLPNVTALPTTTEAFDSFPVNFTIDAGENFDLEISCTEGNGSVCSGNWLYWDTDAVFTGSTQLTTSWSLVYSNQPYTTTNLNVWLWVVIPNAELPKPYSWTFNVRITIA